MARRHSAGGRPRGGDVVQAARAHLPRLATAAGALAAAAAVAIPPGLAEQALFLLGGAGVALLAVTLGLRRAALVAPALVLLAAGYAAELSLRDEAAVDAAAPLVGAGLVLAAELAYWSLDLARTGREETRSLLRRLAAILVLAGGALTLAAGVLLVTAAPVGGGLGWRLVGIAAAAAAIAIIARLARRPSAQP